MAKILIAEDEDSLRGFVSRALELDGHEVDQAVDGAHGLERLRASGYDLLLSDIRMPVMDGSALYRALAVERPQQIDGLAFITGDTLTSGVRQFLETSERPYLEKPILPHDVRELIDLLMRRKAQ